MSSIGIGIEVVIFALAFFLHTPYLVTHGFTNINMGLWSFCRGTEQIPFKCYAWRYGTKEHAWEFIDNSVKHIFLIIFPIVLRNNFFQCFWDGREKTTYAKLINSTAITCGFTGFNGFTFYLMPQCPTIRKLINRFRFENLSFFKSGMKIEATIADVCVFLRLEG